jgi:hypothetical protein
LIFGVAIIYRRLEITQCDNPSKSAIKKSNILKVKTQKRTCEDILRRLEGRKEVLAVIAAMVAAIPPII